MIWYRKISTNYSINRVECPYGVIFVVDHLGWIPSDYQKNCKDIYKLLEQASRVSWPWTRVISKIDLLRWNPSSYPRWNHLKNVQYLFKLVNRVSNLYTGVTNKIDRLGWTLSGYPRWTKCSSIHNILEQASSVAFITRLEFLIVDLLGWTPSSYPRWTN